MNNISNTDISYMVLLKYEDEKAAKIIRYTSIGGGYSEFYIVESVENGLISLKDAKRICELFNEHIHNHVTVDDNGNFILSNDDIDTNDFIKAEIVEVNTTINRTFTLYES